VRAPGLLFCPRCGAASTSPWPTEEVLERAYSSWYRPASGRFGSLGDALLRRTRGRLARRIERIAPAGAVLDVGSGDGALLDALHAGGRTALGLERKSSRPDVLEGQLSEVEGEWAAVVFWHSLEHLPEPGADLARAAAMLAPGGVLCVALPNLQSLQARAFGPHWLALDLPRHLVHVPASALIRRLEELGLRVERVSHLRGGQVVFGWLHGLVGALPGGHNLYWAIRRPAARERPMPAGRRVTALVAGAALLPVAAALALLEAAIGRGGIVYVEARRPAA
jgi:SAM-dependent methyltransferase